MTVYYKQTVEIPEGDGVHIKVAGAKKEKYVYKYVRYFRNAEGNPRNKAKVIGKFDAGSGKMFPNSNYFNLFNIDPAMPYIDVWDYGYSYIVLKICRDMGLLDCLAGAFGKEHAMDIIVMASYIIREGNSMDGIDDWQQRNYFPKYTHLLTPQFTRQIFAKLSNKKMNNFFRNWVKISLGEGTVCYDVTSISSYAQQMPAVERGYNRDGQDSVQFNLGMFCDESSKVPIYYNTCSGSLTDKTNLSYVLANAKAVGIKNVKLLVDGEFPDKVCFTSLRDLCDSFMAGLPTHLKDSQDILDTYGSHVDNYANKLNVPHTFCITLDSEIHGVSGKVLLYFDALSHVLLCNELSERINRFKAELSSLKHYPKSNLKRYVQYFTLVKHRQGSGFDFEINVNKVEKIRKSKGLFLIFTTDMNLTPEDTLYHYRAKDDVEKLFDQIKYDMEGNPHDEQTTDGKVFVTFIACIIRTYLMSKLNPYLKDNPTSLKKVLEQLSNITIVSGGKGLRFTKALSKKQREILKPFKGDSSIINSTSGL